MASVTYLYCIKEYRNMSKKKKKKKSVSRMKSELNKPAVM